MKRILPIFVALLLLIGSTLIALNTSRNASNSISGNTHDLQQNEVNFAGLKHLEFADTAGNVRKLSEWNGKIIMLNFWATWCPPCKREIPTFVELQEQYGNAGVQFLGLATDDPEKVVKFSEENQINYPLLQAHKHGMELAYALGNRHGALPFTVIFDTQGNRVYTHTGELTHKRAEEILKPLLTNP